MRQQIVTPVIEQPAVITTGPHADTIVQVHWSELSPTGELLYAVSLPDDSFTHVPADNTRPW